MGISYMYHADSLNWPEIHYEKIKTPSLAVAGEKDTLIQSSDTFIEKAKQGGVEIKYLRVLDMDHYVRKRQDILDESFNWLKNFVKHSH